MDTSEQSAVKRVPPRRRRTEEEKRGIVQQTLEAGASVARVARAHGVNANQVFAWRRQYRRGLLGEGNAETVKLLPVHVSGTTAGKTNCEVRGQAAPRTTVGAGAIHVALAKGHVRITGRVDAEALRAVLEQLLG